MSIVAIGRTDDKFRGLDVVLDQSGFEPVIQERFVRSGKPKESFTIAWALPLCGYLLFGLFQFRDQELVPNAR